MGTAPRFPGGITKKAVYIDRVCTTSTGGYSARVVGISGILNKDGYVAGTTDDVRFDPYTTAGETDYGILGLSNTTFSYTPKYSGYYFESPTTSSAKKIDAGTKLTWSYSVSKNMTFIFFDIE